MSFLIRKNNIFIYRFALSNSNESRLSAWHSLAFTERLWPEPNYVHQFSRFGSAIRNAWLSFAGRSTMWSPHGTGDSPVNSLRQWYDRNGLQELMAEDCSCKLNFLIIASCVCLVYASCKPSKQETRTIFDTGNRRQQHSATIKTIEDTSRAHSMCYIDFGQRRLLSRRLPTYDQFGYT